MTRFARWVRTLDPDQLLTVWTSLIVLQSDYTDSNGHTAELARAIATVETRLSEEGE